MKRTTVNGTTSTNDADVANNIASAEQSIDLQKLQEAQNRLNDKKMGAEAGYQPNAFTKWGQTLSSAQWLDHVPNVMNWIRRAGRAVRFMGLPTAEKIKLGLKTMEENAPGSKQSGLARLHTALAKGVGNTLENKDPNNPTSLKQKFKDTMGSAIDSLTDMAPEEIKNTAGLVMKGKISDTASLKQALTSDMMGTLNKNLPDEQKQVLNDASDTFATLQSKNPKDLLQGKSKTMKDMVPKKKKTTKKAKRARATRTKK